MAKKSAIFLLQFFENIWNNQRKAERKVENTRIKKVYYYFPLLTKKFPIEALPTGYHSSHPPSQNQFCNYNICNNNILNNNGHVLICEHAYH